MNEKKITLTEEQFELLMGCLEQCIVEDQRAIAKYEDQPNLYPQDLLKGRKSDLERTEELYKILQES